MSFILKALFACSRDSLLTKTLPTSQNRLFLSHPLLMRCSQHIQEKGKQIYERDETTGADWKSSQWPKLEEFEQ